MKRINLLYWRPYNDAFTNYGDELSPFIISAISSSSIQHKNAFCIKWFNRVKQLLKSIIKLDYSSYKRILWPNEPNVLAIGSILRFGNSVSSIWGSGFMSNKEKARGGNVFALRGKLSLQLAMEQGLLTDDNVTLGDPALLLPLILPSSGPGTIPVGIIPHYSEYDTFVKKYPDCMIINLVDRSVEDITRDILSCKCIISTSLHGLIIPHAYGIPALWFELSGLECDTKGFKFFDYFSSVGIEEYHPFTNFDDILSSTKRIEKFFLDNIHISLPQINIKQIQRDLLMHAPFDIKKEYLNER